MKKFCSLY